MGASSHLKKQKLFAKFISPRQIAKAFEGSDGVPLAGAIPKIWMAVTGGAVAIMTTRSR
jgi:hypothetical protein